MKRLLSLILMFIFVLSCVEISASEPEQWWDDGYNYRVRIIPQSSTNPGTVTIDLGQITEDLGLYSMDPEWGFDEGVDPESLRLVALGASQQPHSFNWGSTDTYVIDDFESGREWNISSDIDTFVSEGDNGDSLKFYKNTDTGVKMYMSVPSESFQDKEYISFYAKGAFKMSLRDPAKGKYIFSVDLYLPEYRMAVIPLSFVNFREGVDFYLELAPLDFVNVNVIDDIMFIDDIIQVTFAPSADDLFLYFNSYVTGNGSGPLPMDDISGTRTEATLAAPEGFRVLMEERPTDVSGTVRLSATVLDNRHDLEHVRYRIDYPSWVGLDEEAYGVWGDMEFDGESWVAYWDTVKTVSDGHHTLVIYAMDSAGAEAFQITEVEVDNIITDENDLAPGVDKFSFAVIGDTQPEAGGGNNPSVCNYIMESIADEEEVDFIVQVGDLTYSGYPEGYTQVKRQVIAYAQVPFYPAIGNHDATARTGTDDFIYFFGNSAYAFDYGNSHFVFLNSEVEGLKGLITGEQLTWLDERLSENADKDHIFIVVHQPIYPVFHGILNQDEVQAVIGNYENVTAIFQGHEHTYFHDIVDGTDVFVTGGATWLDPQYLEENTFNHYFVISVDGEEFEWKVVETSNFYLEAPLDGASTEEGSIEVVGHTQPYIVVSINDASTTSDVRGEFKATVQLDYGENTITASATGLPDGAVHSSSVTVTREMPLTLDVPETVSQGEPLNVVVTSPNGPVEGALVQVMTQTDVTDGEGNAQFETYPLGTFKVSAYGDGYYGVYEMVTSEGASGGGSNNTIAIAVIAVIALGVVYSVLRKK